MPRKHIEPLCDRDMSFKRMTLPGFGQRMKYKMLSIDNDTGACSMTVQYGGGYKQPPSISKSTFELLIMEGSLKIGDKLCRPGFYAYVPKGVSLPAFYTRSGCLALLMYNDTEPHIEESDQDAGHADRAGLIQVHSYDDLNWEVANLFPAVEPGCMIKLLRMDETSHALSFLYFMNPGFWQDNISYHDCSEEAYHIWGTSWMMQFGDIPTGGYFYRPAWINHGAFASEKGILAFGRTDGELYNHFHFNAYSNIEENQHRAAARLLARKPELFKWVVAHGHNHPTVDW